MLSVSWVTWPTYFCQVILGHCVLNWGLVHGQKADVVPEFFWLHLFSASVMNSTEVVLGSPSLGKMGRLQLGGARVG